MRKVYALTLFLIILISCARGPEESLTLSPVKIEKLTHHLDKLSSRKQGKASVDPYLHIEIMRRGGGPSPEFESLTDDRDVTRRYTISKDLPLELDLIFKNKQDIKHITSLAFELKTSGEIHVSLHSEKDGPKLYEDSIPPLDDTIPIEISLDTIKMKYLMDKVSMAPGCPEDETAAEKSLYLRFETRSEKEILLSLGDFKLSRFTQNISLSNRLVKISERNLNSIVYPLPNEITLKIRAQAPFYIQGFLGNKTTVNISYRFFIDGREFDGYDVPYNDWHFVKIPVDRSKGVVEVKIESPSEGIGILGNFVLVPEGLKVKQNERIIIYLSDALRSDFGGIDYDSLGLAEVFQDGVVFRNAFSNAIETRDSLPVLFTGIYKYILNNDSAENPFVYDTYETIPEYLDQKGFMTAAFIANSWIILSNSAQGFDHVFHNQSKIKTEDLKNTSVDMSESVYREITNGAILEEARRFIEYNIDKPVFIYIHTMENHAPYGLPRSKRNFSASWKDEILRKLRINSTYFYKLNNPTEEELKVLKDFYKDEVLEMSRNFSSFYAALEELNIADDTFLLFTSDHGERFFEHRTWSHGGHDIYNEVIRIPLILKHPNSSRQSVDKNVSLVDVFPTIAAYQGDSEKAAEFIGSNLLDPSLIPERIVMADGVGDKLYMFLSGDIKVIFDKDKIWRFDLQKDRKELNGTQLKDKTLAATGDLSPKDLLELRRRLIPEYYRKGIKLKKRLTPEEIRRLKSLGYLK